jgi:hypothetical protein
MLLASRSMLCIKREIYNKGIYPQNILRISYVNLSPGIYGFGIIDSSWKFSTAQVVAIGMLHIFIIPHVPTQLNRVGNFHVILLLLIFPRDHPLSRFLWDSQTLSLLITPVIKFHQTCFPFMLRNRTQILTTCFAETVLNGLVQR